MTAPVLPSGEVTASLDLLDLGRGEVEVEQDQADLVQVGQLVEEFLGEVLGPQLVEQRLNFVLEVAVDDGLAVVELLDALFEGAQVSDQLGQEGLDHRVAAELGVSW